MNIEIRHLPLIITSIIVLQTSVSTSAAPLPQIDSSKIDKRFQKFVEMKEKEIQKVAEIRGIAVPEPVTDFFKAVHAGHWSRAGYIFENMRRYRGKAPSDAAILSTGIHDILGTYGLMYDWTPELIRLYIKEALREIPDNSIIFGGTDAGRFLITYGAATIHTQNIVVITQNALADNRYTDYIRAALTNRIKIISRKDIADAFQEYINEVKAGKRGSKGGLTFKNGKAEISDVWGVMGLNGILARKLVDMNKDGHRFFVEESYIIDWMHPYLTPHGLIMELNDTTTGIFPPKIVQQDQMYWNNLETKLKSNPDFAKTDARKAFIKCRCAIGGLYANHKMREQAISAFRQAIRMQPDSPEANFRLANLYKDAGYYDEAGSVIIKYMEQDIPAAWTNKAARYLKVLRKLKADKDK